MTCLQQSSANLFCMRMILLKILVAGKNCAIIQQRLSSELESIWEWLIDNKLSLHFGKTESIVFGSKRRLQGNNSIEVTCDGQIISSISCLKYLGVELDKSLSNTQTADKIVSNSNGKIKKILYRQTRHFNMKTKKIANVSTYTVPF